MSTRELATSLPLSLLGSFRWARFRPLGVSPTKSAPGKIVYLTLSTCRSRTSLAMLSCRNPPRGCASGSRAACQSAIALSPCLTARRHPTQLPPLILRTNCAVHQALCPRRHIAAASTSGTAAAGGGDGEQDAAAAATPSPATTAAAASSSSREGEREGHPAQHFRAVPEPEVEPKTLFGKLSFSDVSYYINVLYWSLLLVSSRCSSRCWAAHAAERVGCPRSQAGGTGAIDGPSPTHMAHIPCPPQKPNLCRCLL